MKGRKLDWLILIALAVFAVMACFLLHTIFLESAFLFFGLPSIYLLCRAKPKKKETFVAVLVFGVLYCFLLNYLAELNGAWAWKSSQLIIQYKFFGVISPDAIIWCALWVLLLVLFYEHMIDHDRKDRVSRRIWWVISAAVLMMAIVALLAIYAPARLHVDHAYFYFGLCTLPPLLFIIYKKPKILPKLLMAAVYFVPLYLAYELTGRYLGNWDFPGHYYGMIQVGTITFPLEEFMFWILLSSVITLGGYELFIDDFK